MKFTQIPVNTFKEIQLNAGVVVDTFDPKTGEIGNLLGATTGGMTFTAAPTFRDDGDDIDNCPKNMMELKRLESIEATLAGTLLTLTATSVKDLIGAADVDDEDETHIIPRNDLLKADFKDVWWVGDYSDLNGEENGGFVAIHMMNALNTAGFQLKSTDKSKGQFAFTYTAHYSMDEQDKVPYEIYVKAGTTE